MTDLTRFIEAQQLSIEDLFEEEEPEEKIQEEQPRPCWWRRCQIDKRPKSGRCQDCSEYVEVY